MAGWLEKNMGINVYLDEVIWGSADKLLKAIDDEYCISDINEDTYDYKKETYQQVMFMQCFRLLCLMRLTKQR